MAITFGDMDGGRRGEQRDACATTAEQSVRTAQQVQGLTFDLNKQTYKGKATDNGRVFPSPVHTARRP